jgi:CTP:molybdopterin cytidylyltransferase MocA
MEGFKPLLRIGAKTMIEHAIGLFKTCGIEAIFTVVGYRSAELIPVVRGTSSRFVINDNYRKGMLSSVQRGIEGLRHDCDAFFLLPVDIPLVQPATIRRLLDAFYQDSSAPVCYPRFQSRRGHPPLINGNLRGQILAYGGQEGMRGILSGYDDLAIDIPVEDPFIRLDADRPEDLYLLRKEYSRYSAFLKSHNIEPHRPFLR